MGGLRRRFIHDSIEKMLRDSLTALGWFNAGRQHAPLSISPKPAKWDDPIDFNTLSVDIAANADTDAEMGSNLTEDRRTVWIDFYAENESLGEHVCGDIADICRGKMASAGRTRPNLDVLDFRVSSPPHLFYCEIENVVEDRARNFPHPWQQFWYVVRFELIDTVGDESYG